MVKSPPNMLEENTEICCSGMTKYQLKNIHHGRKKVSKFALLKCSVLLGIVQHSKIQIFKIFVN